MSLEASRVEASPPIVSWKTRLPGVVAGLALVVDAALLRWVGFGWGQQLVFVAVVGVWCLAGSCFVPAGVRASTRLPAAAAAGMTVHMGIAFLTCQDVVVRFLGLPDMRAAAALALLLTLPLAVVGAFRLGAWPWAIPSCISATTALLLLLASVVAWLTAFGWFVGRDGEHTHVRDRLEAGQPVFGGPDVPAWGTPQDRRAHVFGSLHVRPFPRAFPHGSFRHQGVETTLVCVVHLMGPHTESRAAAATKPLVLLWLWVVASLTCALARDVVGSSERGAAMAGVGALLYAAVNPAALLAPLSSYRVAPVAGALYHNLTQQASLAAGLTGLYLAALSLGAPAGPGRRRLFAGGCLLVALSLFYKPSFFSIAAPALVVAAALDMRRTGLRGAAVGVGLLTGAAAAWYLYPTLAGLERLSAHTRLAFLDFQRNTELFVPVEGQAALVAQVLLLSYAAFLPALAAILARLRREGSGSLRGLVPGEAAMLPLLVAAAGLLSGHFLAEQGTWAGSGRFMFGYAAAYTVLLPFLVRWIEGLTSRPLRTAAWTLYGVHLASGAWNLWVFAYYGRI